MLWHLAPEGLGKLYMGDWTQFSSEFNITFFKRYKHQEKAKHPHDKFAKLQPSPCPLLSRLTAQMSFNMYKENKINIDQCGGLK